MIAISRASSPELAASQKAAGPGAIEFRACDLSESSRISDLVKELRSEFGAPYGLINNAGLGTSGILSNMRESDVQRLIQLNTIAPILLTKHVVRAMMLKREGRIINIASIVATTGYSGLSVYSATKAALLGFSRSLAREVGPLGITVNTLSPGFVMTEMTHELDEAQRETISRRSALKRMPEPIDVARAAEFLLGDGARNITATNTIIDAGNTA